MQIHRVGPFNLALQTSGTGPFTAEGFIQPQRSQEPLRRVVAEGATEQEAKDLALDLARKEAAEMWLDPRYRHHVD